MTKYASLNLCKVFPYPVESDRVSVQPPSHVNSSKSDEPTIASPKPYIPPFRRSTKKAIRNTAKPKGISNLNANPVVKDNSIMIQNDECEAAWWECQNLGIFIVWNGPSEEMFFLSKWLKENCHGQVSISYFSDKVLYLNCLDELVKKEFANVSKCFFNGHIVKFVEWFPNFKLQDLDLKCPIWFNIQSLLLELNQIEILKSIGSACGEFIGINASFQYYNNVKLLIKTKFNQFLHFHKKVITNKTTYDLNLHSFEGEISKIIKIEDNNGLGFQNIPLTLDFQSMFPMIYNLRKKKGIRFS